MSPSPLRFNAGATYTLDIATNARIIELPADAYALLQQEAARRGVAPDELAEQLLRADLQPAGGWDGLDDALVHLAELRDRLPQIDGVELARAARDELEARGR